MGDICTYGVGYIYTYTDSAVIQSQDVIQRGMQSLTIINRQQNNFIFGKYYALTEKNDKSFPMQIIKVSVYRY